MPARVGDSTQVLLPRIVRAPSLRYFDRRSVLPALLPLVLTVTGERNPRLALEVATQVRCVGEVQFVGHTANSQVTV